MPEYIGVIHAHTTASDGRATFPEIVHAAREARLDFLITTDHNCLPQGEAGYRDGVLLIVGQEVHDEAREPQVNHLLCIGVTQDVSALAPSPQRLVDAVNAQGGLTFIAHPVEFAPSYTLEPAIPWVDWGVSGIHGIEIWNYMSEFKAHATGLARGAQAAYWPTSVIVSPFPEALARWDDMLRRGPMVAIGGPDAHGWKVRRGPLNPTILPYPFLFRAVRTHLVTEDALNGDFAHDQRLVLAALRRGHVFVAYDAIGDATGFRFEAHGREDRVGMGDAAVWRTGLRLVVRSPLPADLRLLRDGVVVATTHGRSLSFAPHEAGVYRVEAYRSHAGQRRGWVFSNPIYLYGAAEATFEGDQA